MKFYNKRLDLTVSEFEYLLKFIDFEKITEEINRENLFIKEYNFKEEDKVVSKLLEKLNNPKDIEYSFNKVRAADKATESRTKAAKEKIQNAINILRMENKKITHYSIAQCSGVSFTTVKKYLDDETLKSLNEVE
jgi:response regulator of citrate/malate metabolism